MPVLLDIVYALVALLAVPRLMQKKRTGWAGRFGSGPALEPSSKPRVLLCAVSLGEVNLLRALVPLLEPETDVVIATTTDTGAARARELFGSRHTVVRYPLDFSWCVRRFLRRTAPDAVVLVELELWPNFLGACRRRGIPVDVINGRLSDRSAPRYRRFRLVTARWFRRLRVVAAQDERSAQRFRDCGARDVRVTGTMKWDAAAEPDEDRVAGLVTRLGIDRARPLVVAGSTAPGEPELIRDALPPGAQLLVAPRRPEWFDSAAEALPDAERWTAPTGSKSDNFVLDTIGRLADAYALADVVVIGRSFGGLHGSDPMEPAAMGKPVFIGPEYRDFRAPVEALRAAGGLAVVNAAELPGELTRVLSDPAARLDMGARAGETATAQRGASQRNAEIIRSLLPGMGSV